MCIYTHAHVPALPPSCSLLHKQNAPFQKPSSLLRSHNTIFPPGIRTMHDSDIYNNCFSSTFTWKKKKREKNRKANEQEKLSQKQMQSDEINGSRFFFPCIYSVVLSNTHNLLFIQGSHTRSCCAIQEIHDSKVPKMQSTFISEDTHIAKKIPKSRSVCSITETIEQNILWVQSRKSWLHSETRTINS